MRAAELYVKLRGRAQSMMVELDIEYGEACNRLMTLGTLSLAGLLPDELLPDLALGLQRWFGPGRPEEPLVNARRRCMKYIKKKNSFSFEVRDNSDRAVQALMMILVDDVDPVYESSLALEVFAEYVWRFERVYENTLDAFV